MPHFGAQSMTNLAGCDVRLQRLFNEVVKHWDCTVTCGFRGEAAQHEAFVTGKSKLDWPNGNHNKMPSYAVDVAPFPVDYNDVNRIRVFAGFVLGVASQMNLNIRWGGDWNQNTEVKDNTFNDLVHFEIKD